MSTKQWFDELIAPDSLRTAASKTKIAVSTLSRQQDQLSPEMVIALCRGYGRSPVTGLVETGFIQPWELEGVSVPYALREATNEQLLDEIMRRSDPEARELFTAGDDETVVDLVDYPGLEAVADSSPEEDEGLPDDYEP